MVLEEFDENKEAVINPWGLIGQMENFPKIAVSCFAYTTFERLIEELNACEITYVNNANTEFPIYKTVYKGIDIALFMSDVGAPGCVGGAEELFALGAEKIVLFGTCGVLDAGIKDCSVIIPNCAVRDEGTGFHYAPPSDEITVNPKYIEDFAEILDRHHCHYTIGKTWSTDAFYRETRAKVEKRKASGCICVDMECSAMAALSQFREKEIFQFFYAADNLDREEWDKRSLSNHDNLLEKDRIAMLAMEMAVRMAEKN